MYLVDSSEEISGRRPSQGKMKISCQIYADIPDISVILSAFLLSGKRVVQVGNQMERYFSLDISSEKKKYLQGYSSFLGFTELSEYHSIACVTTL